MAKKVVKYDRDTVSGLELAIKLQQDEITLIKLLPTLKSEDAKDEVVKLLNTLRSSAVQLLNDAA